jgi:biotin transport system substrate-specific component
MSTLSKILVDILHCKCYIKARVDLKKFSSLHFHILQANFMSKGATLMTQNTPNLEAAAAKRAAAISTKDMASCAMFAVLIAVGAFIKIPIPVVPFTLQFFFTMLAGIILGGRLGAISVGIYICLGLLGLPIFAEGGGIWYVLKPSFGYLLGFCLATFVNGKLIERMKETTIPKCLAANFLGLLIVYAVGMIYYYIICNYVIMTPIALPPLILYCFLLAVPGDICLCILAALLTKQLRAIYQAIGNR